MILDQSNQVVLFPIPNKVVLMPKSNSPTAFSKFENIQSLQKISGIDPGNIFVIQHCEKTIVEWNQSTCNSLLACIL